MNVIEKTIRRRPRRAVLENRRRAIRTLRAPGLFSFLGCLAVLIALTGSVVRPLPLEAADFLFTWKPSTDPAVTSYGVYQRIADSPYELIDEVKVEDLDDPAFPSYLATGLITGNTYRFAATSISFSSESDLHSNTCITLNSEITPCDDDDDNQATVFVSCFISAAGEKIFRKTAGR